MVWREILLLSLANAAIAFTVSETKLFASFRHWIEGRSRTLGGLVACGYCLGHWSAFVLTVIYRPRLFHAWAPLDYFLTALVIAWLGAFQWIALCWLVQKTGK